MSIAVHLALPRTGRDSRDLRLLVHPDEPRRVRAG